MCRAGGSGGNSRLFVSEQKMKSKSYSLTSEKQVAEIEKTKQNSFREKERA